MCWRLFAVTEWTVYQSKYAQSTTPSERGCSMLQRRHCILDNIHRRGWYHNLTNIRIPHHHRIVLHIEWAWTITNFAICTHSTKHVLSRLQCHYLDGNPSIGGISHCHLLMILPRRKSPEPTNSKCSWRIHLLHPNWKLCRRANCVGQIELYFWMKYSRLCMDSLSKDMLAAVVVYWFWMAAPPQLLFLYPNALGECICCIWIANFAAWANCVGRIELYFGQFQLRHCPTWIYS